MSEPEVVLNGTLSRRDIVGRHTGADAISLSIFEFRPGLSPGLSSPVSDHILFRVNTGQPRASSCEVVIDGSKYVVAPETGVYVRPGEIMFVANNSTEPVVFVSSRCPEPSNLTVVDDVRDVRSERLEKRTIALADRRSIPTGDRWYRVLVDDEMGSANATQFVGAIPPGRAPDHFHEYEEVLFILRGKGRMWAGESHAPIAPGSCVYLPRRQVHCVENNSDGELRLLGVFYPAGSPAVRY